MIWQALGSQQSLAGWFLPGVSHVIAGGRQGAGSGVCEGLSWLAVRGGFFRHMSAAPALLQQSGTGLGEAETSSPLKGE